MADYHPPLLPGHSYHILSRAVGSEKMFRERKNYPFFLARYQKHIPPVADTYCYCLLPNHFHFLVRKKNEDFIKKHFEAIKKDKIYRPEFAAEFIMERFSNLLNSYTKSYNKTYDRKGSLFIDSMRRVDIKTDDQFLRTAFYIHNNPVNHGYCQTIDQWPWSSYNTILSNRPTILLREDLLNSFGGLKEFRDYHNQSLRQQNL